MERAGLYVVSIKVSDTTLEHCEAGVIGTFDIVAKDRFGNKLAIGGAVFSVLLQHRASSQVSGDVTSNNHGTTACLMWHM